METERFVRSFDGTMLYTSSVGEGPPIILCDGIGCDGFIWRYIRATLQDSYKLIFWHYRGHGKSYAPADPDALGMEALRADLTAVLDAYQIDRAVLLGHSMGVQLILDFALAHPERVKGLVPICGSYGEPLRTLHGNGRVSLMFPVIRDSVLRWPGRGQRLWRRFFASSFAYAVAMRFEVNGKVLLPDDMRLYFAHLACMDARVFVRLLDRIRHHTVEDRLREIAAPTLVIAGERDTFTPAWLSQRMHQLIPKSELLLIPGGTHVAPLEIPELLNLRLERFLERRIFNAA